jgi:hypothetical protein
MVDTQIKPHREQVAEQERRLAQRRAAAILAWWLFHTNPKWIFPPGWWRL